MLRYIRVVLALRCVFLSSVRVLLFLVVFVVHFLSSEVFFQLKHNVSVFSVWILTGLWTATVCVRQRVDRWVKVYLPFQTAPPSVRSPPSLEDTDTTSQLRSPVSLQTSTDRVTVSAPNISKTVHQATVGEGRGWVGTDW